MMFNLDQFHSLIQAVDNSTTNHEKGHSFEELAAYILDKLDGVEVTERNVNLSNEEIDLLLWNARIEDVLNPWDSVILVECKNWSAPVGASVLDNFINKVRRRHLKTGIFIAANGVTGDFVNGNNANIGAVQTIQDALIQDGMRIIVIRMEDLRNITSLDEFRELIKQRYCKVYMRKVF